MTGLSESILRVTGEVAKETSFSYGDLQQLDSEFQVPDFSTIESGRPGSALRLRGILAAVQENGNACFLGMHSSHDDFHASIPLEDVRDRGFVLYGLDGAPLPLSKGGPIRFFIPDHAACNTDDIDECANVKYIDHIELTRTRGFDNRPTDEEEHAKLHDHE